MGDDLREDLISDLPQSITETILTKLPIRDAVWTSTLSSTWRYKWTTITDLVFNDDCVSSCYDRPYSESNLVNFITGCLFLHNGPIRKFALCSSILQSSPDIDQWLLFLSRKGTKELSIELGEGEWFTAPSCLFKYSKLAHLELVRCELNPPPNFKGFLCLKYLNLQRVLMAPDDIEYLISSCPLLESLTLSDFDSLGLTLRAPNLKYLMLEGEFMDICLENTPRLATISVAMYMTDDIAEQFKHSSSCTIDKLLGGVPCIERLCGQIYFTKFLSIGIDRRINGIKYEHLQIIELDEVNFEDDKEVLAVFCVIVHSPNLKELQISGSSYTSAAVVESDLDIWEVKRPMNYILNQLKTVKIAEVSGTLHELGFIKFLLENASVLSVLTIIPSVYITDGRLNMLVNLVGFRRASPQAEVIFVQQ